MVRAMRIRGGRLLLALLVFLVSRCCCEADDAEALLGLKNAVRLEPFGVLAKWEGESVCTWHGITCGEDGRVRKLELPRSSLQGRIGAEIYRLEFVEIINLEGNKLYGPIPRNLWTLKKLKLLDLSGNRLSGSIPFDVGYVISLTTLNLARNKLKGVLPRMLGKLVELRHLQLNGNQFTGSIPDGFCSLRQLQTLDLSDNAFEGDVPECLVHHPSSSFKRTCLYSSSLRVAASDHCGIFKRILQSKPQKNATEQREGPHKETTESHTHRHAQKTRVSKKVRHHHSHLVFGLLYVVPVIVAAGLVALVLGVFFYRRRTAAVSPWKAGMSGHLQKVFVTDVPSLSWTELQTACEDFSNIIGSSADSVVFKGTLSDGTEVAVTSIRIPAASWTASSEIFFRRKIEALARMKHTHLVNLLGYCAEEEPFARMLLFEYAPNGTLSEHLHNDDSEHLDWSMRMRIVMGAAYGLEYMHHELVPPASHSNFDSNAIYLTEDYAAKLADFGISRLAVIKSDRRKSFSNNIGYDDFEGSDRHAPDFENNVFSFGLFLLEVVTGRLPYTTDKEGSLLEWAVDFLISPETVGYMVDSSLKDFDLKQVLAICDVVRMCIQPDCSKRPSMKAVASTLAKALNMSPQTAQPKTSPLLWAELEILSPC